MKIIPASATIIEDDLAKLTLPERIEQCGRICYKSEGKIKPGSAEPFCEKVIKQGHNSVLEMATVTCMVKADHIPDFFALFLSIEEAKFLKISVSSEDTLLVTGSVRTFRDLYSNEQAFEHSEIVRCLYRKINFMDGHPIRKHNQPLNTWIKLNTVSILEDSDWELILATDPLVYAKHRHAAVKFIVNRAISHELVRHRPCSFLQESQRYVNMKDGVTFITPSAFLSESRQPCGVCEKTDQCEACRETGRVAHNSSVVEHEMNRYASWLRGVESSEVLYASMLKSGASPQEARLVLPNSTKTELILYTNLEEWKHIFSQRDNKAADPAMREVMGPLHEEFRKRWPRVFGSPKEEENKEKDEQE